MQSMDSARDVQLGLHQRLEKGFQGSMYRKILQVEAVLDAAKDVQQVIQASLQAVACSVAFCCSWTCLQAVPHLQVPATALPPPAAQTQQRLKAALRYLIQTVELVQHSIVLQLLGILFVAAGVADVTSLHRTLKASMQEM